MHFIFKNCFFIMKLETEKGSDNNAYIRTDASVNDTISLGYFDEMSLDSIL